jgi:hypothetical protein
VTLAGGVDASHPTASQRGAVALSAPNGRITVGSLDASRFKTIALQPNSGVSLPVQVTGVLTNFTVSESPKRFTFLTNCVIGSDIYYLSVSNKAISLVANYDIYVLMDGLRWDGSCKQFG